MNIRTFSLIFIANLKTLKVLNPTSKDPIPLRYHGRSHFGLYIAIDHVLPGTYRGHMPKFRLISLKLNEMLRFENFEITRFFPFVDT